MPFLTELNCRILGTYLHKNSMYCHKPRSSHDVATVSKNITEMPRGLSHDYVIDNFRLTLQNVARNIRNNRKTCMILVLFKVIRIDCHKP